MKLHDHRLLKTLASAGAALFALCATTLEASAGAVGGHVDITGSMLNVGGAPARFFCATGVTVPHPRRTAEGDGEAGETAWNEAAEEAMRIVSSLARSGFNMVRIPNMPIGDSGIQGAHTIPEMYDFFVSLCNANGIRVWAEIMYPATIFPVSPADVGSIDDPYSAEAWVDAVKGFDKPFEGMLAAPWDPRTEVVIQWRVREWARSFNPYTGMRRSDDPVFAAWSFEQLLFDDFERMEADTLPGFFTNSLSVAWNNWLYRDFSDDADFRAKIPDITSGESVETGTVEFAYASTVCAYCDANEIPRDKCARRRLQRVFLKDIYLGHIERVVRPFSVLGASSRNSPIFVSADSQHNMIGEHSTAEVIGPFDEVGNTGKPLIMYPDTQKPSYLHIEEACYAATNGVSVMAAAYGEEPELAVFASQIFLSGTALDDKGKIDKPDLALWHGLVAEGMGEIAFGTSGVAITNLEFQVSRQPGQTNDVPNEVPENVVFSFSVRADYDDGHSIANSARAVVSAYAVDVETHKPVDFSFVLSSPGLEGKEMAAYSLEGDPAEVKLKKNGVGLDVVEVGPGSGVFRIELEKKRKTVQSFFE